MLRTAIVFIPELDPTEHTLIHPVVPDHLSFFSIILKQ